MSKPSIAVGDVFSTNEGSCCTVVSIASYRAITVRFNDTHAHTLTVSGTQLKSGKVKNPYFPSKWGTGFLGVGDFTATHKSKPTKPYVAWSGMLARCYSARGLSDSPTYVNCSVAPIWHNFQIFAEWYTNQNKPSDWEMDKDILVQGNRVYSPDTCRLVPQAINSLILSSTSSKGSLPVGVKEEAGAYVARIRQGSTAKVLGSYPTVNLAFAAYKRAKKAHIKFVADTFSDVLDPEIYQALLNFEVNMQLKESQ